MQTQRKKKIKDSYGDCCLELSNEQEHKSSLKYVSVEEHQKHDNQCEQNANILNAGKMQKKHEK